MNNNVIIEIPEMKKDLFSETFHLATTSPAISTQRKIRIMNLYTDLSEQIKQNHKLIYTSYGKDHLKRWLNDLLMFYHNSGQIALKSNVESFLKEL